MMGSQNVFERYEIKYLLTEAQKKRVLAAMEPYMEQDAFGRSVIRNVYYDTDTYRLARRSLEGPAYKEKLRVRSYRQAEPEDGVFIELKKKYKGVVYKRRILLPERSAVEYLSGRAGMPGHSQIAKEIEYFRQFYEALSPKVFLSYEREAWFAKDFGAFRVTFDENILWRETDLSLEKGIYGAALLAPGQTLMEVKTPGSIPLWLVEALSAGNIRKAHFSKYGNAYIRIARGSRKAAYDLSKPPNMTLA